MAKHEITQTIDLKCVKYRRVSKNIYANEMKMEESFFRFIESKGKCAENISRLIFRELEIDGIQIGDCHGQTGLWSGMQLQYISNEINLKVSRTDHSMIQFHDCVQAVSVAIYSV